MTPGEIAWRLKSSIRDKTDRFRLAKRVSEAQDAAASALASGDGAVRFPQIPATACNALQSLLDEDAQQRLISRAALAGRGELELLGGARIACGLPIQWNRDHRSGVDCPLTYAPTIDYRDFREVGDCKWVWEPARCHHWVVLGRAYRLTGDARFAQAVCDQWTSWLDQCPFGYGMHWRSPLELGIRLINWAWAYALIDPSGLIRDPLRKRIWQAVELHLQDISRKYSQGSSANNHLVGEAAGVLIGSVAFGSLPRAPLYRDRAAAILEREIQKQILPDGVNAERATGYHGFVLQFFVLAGLCRRSIGIDFSDCYWQRVRAQFEYLLALREGGHPIPAFNDSDDGYVLDLGGEPRSIASWIDVGLALFPDLASQYPAARHDAGGAEIAFWLLGFAESPVSPTHGYARLNSRSFPHGGIYLLQCGGVSAERDDRVSVAIDCGPLGFGSIAAHGHADALSFTLRVSGVEVLTDPGTYDYFTYPQWRNYLRSTAAHNTATVDDLNQSELLGLFLWGKRATAACRLWEPNADGGRFIGDHDGYRRLLRPVTHSRRLELCGAEQTLEIQDDFLGEGEHGITLYWHFSEHARIAAFTDSGLTLDLGHFRGTMEWDPQLSAELVEAVPEKLVGWVSRGYHQKCPSATLVARGRMTGNTRFITRFTFVQRVRMDDAEEVSLSRREQVEQAP